MKPSGTMHAPLLKPLNELCYLLECAAVDYTGELKSELLILCSRIENREPGFDLPVLEQSLPRLREALECYRRGDRSTGATRLAGVSRDWWNAALP